MSFIKKMITKRHLPSRQEFAKLSKKENFFKVSGDKVFATLQGEGLPQSEGGTAGCPAVFFRLQWCNLHCGFPSGWKCDTGYTWDTKREEYWQEPEDWSIEKSVTEIEKAWNERFDNKDNYSQRLVITGGEPLIQQDMIIKLLDKMPKWQVEIETNGTIEPNNKLISCQINCSPKLSNSGNELEKRLKPKILQKINDWPTSWFKFVVNNQTDVEEIEKIVNDCHLNPGKVLIMPEGITKEAVTDNRKKIEKKILEKGWKIIKRYQLIWFGPKRRT